VALRGIHENDVEVGKWQKKCQIESILFWVN
jgi:hypothetical protein